MATVLVGTTNRAMLVTLFLAGVLCACRPAGDGHASPTAGSAPTVLVQNADAPIMPMDGGEDASSEAVSRDAGILVPIVGSFYEDYVEIFDRKISEDGRFVVILENFYSAEPSTRYTNTELPNRYLMVKRVDDDAEVFRLLIDTPGDHCGAPPTAPTWVQSAPVCAERQARADAFLSRHKWVRLPVFEMDPAARDVACSQKPQRQRLVFRNLEITIGALRVIVTRPTGDVLVDRKLKAWRVFRDSPVPPNDAFFVDLIGLNIERRTLLVEVGFCGTIANADTDPRFHAIRIPPID